MMNPQSAFDTGYANLQSEVKGIPGGIDYDAYDLWNSMSKEDLENAKREWNHIKIMVGLAAGAVAGAEPIGKGISKGINKGMQFLQNPLSTTVNIGTKTIPQIGKYTWLPTTAAVGDGLYNTAMTIDGFYNLFTDNGVQKTVRLAKDGDVGGAIKSGVGDVLDASGIFNFGKHIYTAPERLANNMYRFMRPRTYSISKDEIKVGLSTIFDPRLHSYVRDNNYFPKNFDYSRDEVFRRWLGFPEREGFPSVYVPIEKSFAPAMYKDGKHYFNATINEPNLRLRIKNLPQTTSHKDDIEAFKKFQNDFQSGISLTESEVKLKNLKDFVKENKKDILLQSHGGVNIVNDGKGNVYMQDIWDINPLDPVIKHFLDNWKPTFNIGKLLHKKISTVNRNIDFGKIFPNSKATNVIYKLN